MTGVKVMGILNATPDSFSTGGVQSVEAALRLAERMIEDGAEIIDVGGESTRPGSHPVDEREEMARVAPLINVLARLGAPISIDTMKPAVARAAVEAGAAMWNDVSALTWSPDSLPTAAALGCDVVLMHMRGEPRTMQEDPRYEDVVAEVSAYLAERAGAAEAAGVARQRIWLDPGIGFGKTTRHNLALIAGLRRIVDLGYPVLLGASRKGFLRAVDRTAKSPADRLGGSVAAALAAARAGVAAVRVHDVRETVQALRVERALAEAIGGG